MGVQRLELGYKLAVMCTCVYGDWGGDVITDLHWLRSADETVKNSIAKAGAEASSCSWMMKLDGMIELNTKLWP